MGSSARLSRSLGSNNHTLIPCSDSSKPEDLGRLQARLALKFPAPTLACAEACRRRVSASKPKNTAGNGHILAKRRKSGDDSSCHSVLSMWQALAEHIPSIISFMHPYPSCPR